jgi:hypothetical protein
MKKKMKRFEAGGLSDAQEEWLGGADRSDPIIMARMRAAVPDVKKETTADNDPYGAANKETTADNDPYGAASKSTSVTPKASKSTVKAVEKAAAKEEPKAETKETPAKKNDVEELKKAIKPSVPKSFKDAGGNTKATKSTAQMPSMAVKLPDPLANFDSKGRRMMGRETDDRRKGGAIKMASGGSVSSASKRGDGCAVRGKTKGRMV